MVRAMVFIGSLLYIAGLLLTDISYTGRPAGEAGMTGREPDGLPTDNPGPTASSSPRVHDGSGDSDRSVEIQVMAPLGERFREVRPDSRPS